MASKGCQNDVHITTFKLYPYSNALKGRHFEVKLNVSQQLVNQQKWKHLVTATDDKRNIVKQHYHKICNFG
jgi:hypothetical protein